MTPKRSILFICTENSARSQMAEGFAKQLAPDGVQIFSAGTNPAQSINEFAIEVMKEHDIDISNQTPKRISDLKDYKFDLSITLCVSAQESCPILAGLPAVVHWDLEDPAAVQGGREAKRKAFKNTASIIRNLVHDLFHRGYFEAFSSQKQNRERILNNLPEGIIAHDLDRKIFFFSEGAERLTGLSAAEVIGNDCHDVFKPNLCGENCSFCDGSDLTPGFQKKRYSTIIPEMNKIRKELDVTIVSLLDENGKAQGVVASLRDKTELKRISRQILKEKKFACIIGQNSKMLELFQNIRDVAAYDIPVYISGETGTGKELVANAIHNESVRKDAAFIPINCGALPEGLVESELFGHVKGSFSGAVRDKKGRFELADGGTIFLDEIAELPKNIQVKLLRFLQEGTLEKVGSEKIITVDVRVVCATSKELKEEVNKGNFRDDLYYRLNVIPILLPPLRERKTDIPLLSEHFLRRIAEKNGKEVRTIAKDALSKMLDYNWPGNVRELENTIQFATIKCKGNVITSNALPVEFTQNSNELSKRGPARKLDIETVKNALIRTGGNKTKAAKILGVGRATLYRFLDGHPDVVPDGI